MVRLNGSRASDGFVAACTWTFDLRQGFIISFLPFPTRMIVCGDVGIFIHLKWIVGFNCPFCRTHGAEVGKKGQRLGAQMKHTYS